MNDRLDIKTPRGQATKIQELEAYFIFERRYTGYKIKHTDKDEPERFDGWIMRDGKKRALVETKCRYDKNYHEFTTEYKNEWLITESKIQRAADCARRECLPLYGFLYIVRGQALIVKRLMDKTGAVIEHRTQEGPTKATVNGGTAVRLNAYIDISDCTPIYMVEPEP